MDLNEDCLIIIFKYLNLKDQISAALAYSGFRTVLNYIWQRTYLNLSLNFGIEHITIKEFAVLINGICETVQQIRLRDLTFERLAVLKLYKYPNLTKFSFTQWSRDPLSDDSILTMTKLFPKLRSFSPHGPFTGIHIENWRYLQYLNLSYCNKIEFRHLERIFEELHLKSVQLNIFDRYNEWSSDRGFRNFCNLEEILINTTELTWLSRLSEFTNLKQLTIADRAAEGPLQEFLRNLSQYKSMDLIELETNLGIQLYGSQIYDFLNLKRLVVVSQEITTYMLNVANILREVILKCCDISMARNLTYVLCQWTQFDFLSIEQCNCGFDIYKVDVDRITQNRTKQLHFNFYENFSHYRDWTYLRDPVSVDLVVEGSSPLLKITSDISTPLSFEPLCLRFR